MGANYGKETRSGVWTVEKDGQEKKLEGVHQIKFYGKEARPAGEPRAVFNPRHVLVPSTSQVNIESGEEGILVRFCDSETFEEEEAIREAKQNEDSAQGEENPENGV